MRILKIESVLTRILNVVELKRTSELTNKTATSYDDVVHCHGLSAAPPGKLVSQYHAKRCHVAV